MAATRNALGVTMLLVAAGCMGGSPLDEVEEHPAPVGPMPAEFSSTTGAIEGLVVDDAFVPVVDANVSLQDPGGDGPDRAVATTGPDGRFVFSRLDPGTYRVAATADGFGGGSVRRPTVRLPHP